jgi:hypothetical protein
MERLERQISTNSSSTLSTLGKLDIKLKSFENQTECLEEDLQAGNDDALVLKTKIAILMGDVEKFQAKEIDGVATMELISGKEEARTKRRALTARVNKVLENLGILHSKCVAEAGTTLYQNTMNNNNSNNNNNKDYSTTTYDGRNNKDTVYSFQPTPTTSSSLIVTRDFATEHDPYVIRKHSYLPVTKGEEVILVQGNLRNGLPSPYQDYVVVKNSHGVRGRVHKDCVRQA